MSEDVTKAVNVLIGALAETFKALTPILEECSSFVEHLDHEKLLNDLRAQIVVYDKLLAQFCRLREQLEGVKTDRDKALTS